MDEQNTWRVSSESLEKPAEQDLSALAGRWNEHLDVVISLPTTVTQGPIAQHISSHERSSVEQAAM